MTVSSNYKLYSDGTVMGHCVDSSCSKVCPVPAGLCHAEQIITLHLPSHLPNEGITW